MSVFSVFLIWSIVFTILLQSLSFCCFLRKHRTKDWGGKIFIIISFFLTVLRHEESLWRIELSSSDTLSYPSSPFSVPFHNFPSSDMYGLPRFRLRPLRRTRDSTNPLSGFSILTSHKDVFTPEDCLLIFLFLFFRSLKCRVLFLTKVGGLLEKTKGIRNVFSPVFRFE